MRTLICTFIILGISAFGFAQSSDLPDKLIPSDQAKLEADRLDAQVFKLLPRHLLNKKYEVVKEDSEYELGIRGNGAFYSFSTKTHSFNNIAEIFLVKELEREPGHLDLVSNYGFITNLGKVQLSKLTSDSDVPALRLLSSYRTPASAEEREYHQKFASDARKAGVQVSTSLPTMLGNTYLARTVRPDKADILVAFTIFRIEKDGSLEIIWKALEQRVLPDKLYFSDVDLRLALQRIIDENAIFKTVAFEVLDNHIRLTGHTTRREFEIFMKAVGGIRTRGIEVKLDEDK